ncbi:TPA: hypothetical protein KL628_004909 [Escherichia coli]|nr:hypothetical protein [Escherichia coli]HBE7578790.1 hypothetical protein [Escherichia coli]
MCVSMPGIVYTNYSRSFGERITDKDAMHQAVVQYAERAAEKLRGERQYCRQVTTFVRTSP